VKAFLCSPSASSSIISFISERLVWKQTCLKRTVNKRGRDEENSEWTLIDERFCLPLEKALALWLSRRRQLHRSLKM
jgi:hypothetical protein